MYLWPFFVMHSVRYCNWNVPAMEFCFSCPFFIVNFLPLGLYRAEFLFDSVEVGVTVYLELAVSLAAARDTVPLWSVDAAVATTVYWVLGTLSNTCFYAGWLFVAHFSKTLMNPTGQKITRDYCQFESITLRVWVVKLFLFLYFISEICMLLHRIDC